jgi:hypothetical protein
MYCWGNFLSYAPASLLFFDGLPHMGMTPDAVQVMPFALVALNIGLPIGARLNKAVGPRKTTLMGVVLMIVGTYLGSYQTRLAPFMFFYALLAGLGSGFAYSTPMIAGWSWFPNRKVGAARAKRAHASEASPHERSERKRSILLGREKRLFASPRERSERKRSILFGGERRGCSRTRLLRPPRSARAREGGCRRARPLFPTELSLTRLLPSVAGQLWLFFSLASLAPD